MRKIIKEKIIDSIATEIPLMTPRDVHVPAVKNKALAVLGMRRSGKTTFLWQLLAARLARAVPRSALLYFNFEDERLAELKSADLHLLLEEYFILYPEHRSLPHSSPLRPAFFLDEIQVVPGWETFIRRILDTENIEIFLSGSSSRLLSREVASSMRGRAMEALVHPFSFREFLRHKQLEPALGEEPSKATRSMLDQQLLVYLQEGGFPEAQGLISRDRMDLLRGYVDTALFRDVVERHAVSHPVALRWLVRHLLGNAAGLFSVQKFYEALRSQGTPVAKDTLHEYLVHLEDAFLVRTVAVATSSERRRQVNPRKAYPIDPGLIPVFDRSNKPNLGHALETSVLLELERRGCERAYVRTRAGLEVDFLSRDANGQECLIQVCSDLRDEETRTREIRALVSAAQEHPQAKLELVTLHSESIPDSLPAEIQVSSASTWLLK